MFQGLRAILVVLIAFVTGQFGKVKQQNIKSAPIWPKLLFIKENIDIFAANKWLMRQLGAMFGTHIAGDKRRG